MNVDLINAILKATKSVITTMAHIDLTPEAPAVKNSNRSWGAISGVIGLAGQEVNGNMILSFDEPSILAIVSGMLGEPFEELDDQVQDAVGELTNMISGAAKIDLRSRGYVFEMALPMVVVGRDVEIGQVARGAAVQIPFALQQGKFVVECSLEDRISS